MASRAHGEFLNTLLSLLFNWGGGRLYIAKCDVPGSQVKHYGDTNNCTEGCLALVEHSTNWEKDYRKETPKPRASQEGFVTTITLYIDLAFIIPSQSSARVKHCLWTDILPTPLCL